MEPYLETGFRRGRWVKADIKMLGNKRGVPCQLPVKVFLSATILLFVLSCGKSVELYKPGELHPESLALRADEKSIVLVGDIMTWDWTRLHLATHGVNYPFEATAPLLQTADLTVGNLEGPVAVEAATRKSRYPYKVPPWTLSGLKWAGFDLVSLANNHLYDCREAGLLETFENLDRVGISYFGAGRDRDAARVPKIVRIGEMKVAFLGFISGETWFHEYEDSLGQGAYEKKERAMKRRFGAGKNKPGAIVATAKTVSSAVKKVRGKAALVVVFIHFGIRYHRPPTAHQREIAYAAIDAGADLVVGHHAHFWQPVELYRGKPIVYGLGNFAFGSANKRADEGLLVRAVMGKNELSRVELFPLYIKNTDTRVLFQTKVMKGASAEEMLRRVRAESKPLGADIRIDNGRGVLNLPSGKGVTHSFLQDT